MEDKSLNILLHIHKLLFPLRRNSDRSRAPPARDGMAGYYTGVLCFPTLSSQLSGHLYVSWARATAARPTRRMRAERMLYWTDSASTACSLYQVCILGR